MLKVSVIIPIHNSSKYLDRLFYTLQNQTLQDIEFIFIENGSTDNSYEKLIKLAKEEPRARVFNIGKSTIGGAINFGIAKANGEFITLNDHDDFYVKDGLKNLYENVTSNNALAVISNIINISCKTLNNNLHKKFNLKTRNIEVNFHKDNIPTIGWACLVNRNFVLKHNIKYMEANMHHDTMFFIDLWQEIYAKENGNELVNFMPNYVSYVRIVEPSTSMTSISYNSKKIPSKMRKKLNPNIYTFKIFAKILKKNKKLYKNVPDSENILFSKRCNVVNILVVLLHFRFSKPQSIIFTYHLAKFYKNNKVYFNIKSNLPNNIKIILYSLDNMAQKNPISFSIRTIKLTKIIREIIDEFSKKHLLNHQHDDENCFCRDVNFDIKKEIIDKFYNNDNSSMVNKEKGTMLW